MKRRRDRFAADDLLLLGLTLAAAALITLAALFCTVPLA